MQYKTIVQQYFPIIYIPCPTPEPRLFSQYVFSLAHATGALNQGGYEDFRLKKTIMAFRYGDNNGIFVLLALTHAMTIIFGHKLGLGVECLNLSARVNHFMERRP